MAERISDLRSEELLALVRNGELDDLAVLQVLRNPYCTVEVALLVAQDRHWLRSTGVRELLAGFRDMPLARCMDLLATLPWLSLLNLAQAPRTPPLIRRQAEKKILQRFLQLTLGEKVALARRSHRPLFRSLIDSREPMVLAALLDNPRLVENDILVMLSRNDTPADLVVAVARHRRWGRYYRVRRAVAESPSAPPPVAISALVQLRTTDLERVRSRPGLDGRVQAAARSLLEKERRGERRMVRSAGDVHRGSPPEQSSGVR